ncbi:hypothetical protein CC80DRAFT_141677 [Byssothecium circinans]|uniref:Uncharacterized protein n=1 Tax=Byssothecium circinans TaxID=147558 RepID=A0A6A5TLG8_9PLEO|nr:hypothetical protein CC80DRAFT_141677 [Byssothecium circinans]
MAVAERPRAKFAAYIKRDPTVGTNGASIDREQPFITPRQLRDYWTGSKIPDPDIRSLFSNSTSSRSSISDLRQSEIENAIIRFLAPNAVLAPLCGTALQLMSKERFVNNFRRLLKIFRDQLLALPRNVVSQELAARLKPKEARYRIAQGIVEAQIQVPDQEEDDENIQDHERATKSYLESWVIKTKSHLPSGKSPAAVEDQSECSSGDEDYAEEQIGLDLELPRTDQVIQMLIDGQPFQDMLVGLKEFLLPQGLLSELLPIPGAQISFTAPKMFNVINQAQYWLEDVTSVEWDWWPFLPVLRPLHQGESRVYWRCFCGTLRWRELRPGQRAILEDLLQRRPTRFRRPLLCESFKSNSPHHTTTPSSSPQRQTPSAAHPQNTTSAASCPTASQTNTSQPKVRETAPTDQGLQAATSGGQTAATPTSNPAVPSGGQTAATPPSNPAVPSGGQTAATPTSNPAVPSGGQTAATPASNPADFLWLIFGAEGPRATLELDQMDDNLLKSDTVFLRRLKERHAQLRGWLRSHASVWKLGYWDFVKVRKFESPSAKLTTPELPVCRPIARY